MATRRYGKKRVLARKAVRRAVIWATLVAAVALALGCAAKKEIKAVEATPTPSSVEPTATPGNQTENYRIKKGDCLWVISGKREVYGDPFLWPLLYKANRDTIQDPDLVYTGQKLRVEKRPSEEQVQQAKKLASDTPPYVPHVKPRTSMPLDYF